MSPDTAKKTRAPDMCTSSFPEIPVTWSEAEGELEDGNCQAQSFESISISSLCMLNQMPAPQAEALRKANRSLSQKDGAFQLAASVLGPGVQPGEFQRVL